MGYITFQGPWNQVSFPLIDSLPLFHLTGMLTIVLPFDLLFFSSRGPAGQSSWYYDLLCSCFLLKQWFLSLLMIFCASAISQDFWYDIMNNRILMQNLKMLFASICNFQNLYLTTNVHLFLKQCLHDLHFMKTRSFSPNLGSFHLRSR